MRKKSKILLCLLIAFGTTFGSHFQIFASTADTLYSNAYSLLQTALSTKTQKSINDARAAIDALKGTGASWAIGEFSKQVDTLQQPILVKIIDAINNAKSNPTQANVNAAKAAIDPDLIDIWRNSYNSAVDKIEQGIINNAVDAYNTAKSTNSSSDILSAWSKISEIKTSTDNNVANWSNTFAEQIKQLAKDNNVNLSSTTGQLSVTEIAKNVNAVVLVEARDKNNNVFATGSGFIISSTGKVITNYHVIDKAYYADVVLQNGTKYEVDGLLGNSKTKDIAIMQLSNASNLSYVQLGDSDTLQLGDSIVAIGSPLGMQNTISTGIVSGLNRVNSREGKDIQISVPINRGSSGGPLFNMNGQVIGITYSGINSTGDLNFAIPINDVKPLMSVVTLTKLSVIIDAAKPSAPTGLTANPVSDSEIQYQWNKVDGADYYYIYLSNDNGITYKPLKDADGNNYEITWKSNFSINITYLKPNTTLLAKVTAVNDGIESDYSSAISAVTLSSKEYFPSLSDVPQIVGATYFDSEYSKDGKYVCYEYFADELSQDILSTYGDLLRSKGWNYEKSGTDLYGNPTMTLYKGNQEITLFFLDEEGTIFAIEGTIH